MRNTTLEREEKRTDFDGVRVHLVLGVLDERDQGGNVRQQLLGDKLGDALVERVAPKLLLGLDGRRVRLLLCLISPVRTKHAAS